MARIARTARGSAAAPNARTNGETSRETNREKRDRRAESAGSSAATSGMNLAVVWGSCSAGVDVRVLESGQRVASLSIRTTSGTSPRGRRHVAGATSVPVTVWDPPAWLEAVQPDDALVVVGAIRRRFFATKDGRRGAKVEVEAVTIARAGKEQRARAWQRTSVALEALA